ncbi:MULTISPECIES: SLC13 family permease [Limibacillus]|jgi:di/tricarboxylate transporter|uniref:Di/tricarboxylate transporter n=1 Tax=Limibacillus halophilus TaxID=1579333 RepID=A0A839SQM6_9PROT|nr:SLC13 family permease [Limibacillus halophilus]MBB3064782.1 di/tricarboxylate transporter [Limibacillus halophilus]
MTQQILLLGIIAATLLLFAWGRWRYDLVAVVALMASVTLGLVPGEDAFSGFGHPAVITVAAILVISHSLQNSGVVAGIGRILNPAGRYPVGQVFVLTGTTMLLSAFMNNVGALALMLPVAINAAHISGRPPSQLLMPISFGSLLGGTLTLIGTPPNIIIAAYRERETGVAFGLFDFSPVGLGIAGLGLLYIAFLGWRLLPGRENESAPAAERFEIEDYITEVRITEGSTLAGRRLVDLETMAQSDLAVVALERRKDRMLAPSPYLRLQVGDVLVLETDPATLKRTMESAGLELMGAPESTAKSLRSDRVGLVEVVVTPGSRFEGRTVRNLRLHTSYGLNLLGVSRRGERITDRLGQVRFHAGDVLLLQGEIEALSATFALLGVLPLAQRELPVRRPDGLAWRSLAVFAASIVLLLTGLLPPQVAFVLAVVALVLLGDITLREVYEAIDWPIVVLLGAMIPVGLAMETSGAAASITAPILALQDSAPIWLILMLLMAVTMLMTDIMNNAATAVLMAPIAITLASGLGVSADPLLMTVAVGASSTYLTPIGHQSNLLVMGPGGYRFSDYWRMGLLLDLLILVVSVPLILLVWPL